MRFTPLWKAKGVEYVEVSARGVPTLTAWLNEEPMYCLGNWTVFANQTEIVAECKVLRTGCSVFGGSGTIEGW